MTQSVNERQLQQAGSLARARQSQGGTAGGDEREVEGSVPDPVCVPCSIEKTLEVIGGKWAFLVLRELFGGTKRFGELQRRIHNISPTALTNTLRHMEEKGVLERRVYPTVPVTVEYTLTPKGQDLHPIIKDMKLWAAKWA